MRSFTLAAALLGALLGLSACGNERSGDKPLLILANGLKSSVIGSGQKPPPVSDQQISQVLQVTTDPLVLIDLVDRETQALMLRIESNGDNDTYGTSSRQSAILNNGVIVGTRGAGGDLMSSKPGELIALMKSGREGTVPYEMRFLNGEGLTDVYSYTCSLRHDGTQRVSRGLINIEGRRNAVVCTGNEKSFDAVFITDSSGYAVVSEQWIGHYLGRASVQALRR